VKFVLWLLAFAAAAAGASEVTLPGGARGGPVAPHGPLDEISDLWRMQVAVDLERRVQSMLADGTIAPRTKAAGTLFRWPVALIPGAPDFVPHTIANFVDQNLAFPGQVRDWNCGFRSYDLASGYNHAGVDIMSFPFAWTKMDRDETIVVAAAGGTILRKDDGHYDRNCGALGSVSTSLVPNALYIRHDDGSIAWYLHLKSGSLTPKQVGETVAAGERIATVGSSGFSTGPHLHFEVYAWNGRLVDPYAGACNAMNADSWWLQQPPYWDFAIARLTVHAAPPTFSNCANPEAPATTSFVTPGSTIYPALYLRDFRVNASISVRILRPNGTEFMAATLTNTQESYSASYWYYTVPLPAGSSAGTWRLQAEAEGVVRETRFQVVAAAPPRGTAVEYYNASFGHYFISADADEIADLDAGAFGGAFERTQRTFPVYASAAPDLAPVCRFFTAPGTFGAKSSHFYTADAAECEALKRNPAWIYEKIAFHVPMPDASGTCPANSLPVYRMYNNGQTGAPNHRFTTDYATRLAFAPGLDWSQEGPGAGVGFCSPGT
jgi:murein DD-endopeptidase MepM/ murein hydrolase activator NlpD